MRYSNKKSLEETIRFVQGKYKNKPSPLQYMNENIGFTPTQVPEVLRAKNNLRGSLLGNYKPTNDTFR